MNKTFFVLIALVISGLLYLLAPILTPFLIGALLAYLVDPLVNRLMRWRIPRLLAVVIVFVLLIFLLLLIVMLLIPLVQSQIFLLIDVVPRTIAWLQDTIVPWLQMHFGIQQTIDVHALKNLLIQNWMKAGGIATRLMTTVMHSGFTIFQWLMNLILIPVVTFYLLRDWDKIIKGIRKILPRSIEPTVVKLARDCDNMLSAFLRGQLLVMISLGLVYSVGLSVIGLQIGLMIGLISGMVSIVPYLGFIVGILIASIAAVVQFGTFTSVILVWVVYLIGQMLESMVFTPLFVGDRIGLHPVAVIFAILAGGILYGFFGVLLALPVAAVLMVLVRFGFARYRNSVFYQ